MTTEETTKELLTQYKRKSEQEKFAICFHAFEWWITQDFSKTKTESDAYLKEKVYNTILDEDWDRVGVANAKYRIPAIDLLYIKEDRLKEGYEAEMKNEANVRESLKLLFKGVMEGGLAYIYIKTKNPDIDGGVGNSIINLLVGHLMLQKSGEDAKNESRKVAIAITAAIENTDQTDTQKNRYNAQLTKYQNSVADIGAFEHLKLVTVPELGISSRSDPTEEVEILNEKIVELQTLIDQALLDSTSTQEETTLYEDSIASFLSEFIKAGKSVTVKTVADLAFKHLKGSKDLRGKLKQIKF